MFFLGLPGQRRTFSAISYSPARLLHMVFFQNLSTKYSYFAHGLKFFFFYFIARGGLTNVEHQQDGGSG